MLRGGVTFGDHGHRAPTLAPFTLYVGAAERHAAARRGGKRRAQHLLEGRAAGAAALPEARLLAFLLGLRQWCAPRHAALLAACGRSAAAALRLHLQFEGVNTLVNGLLLLTSWHMSQAFATPETTCLLHPASTSGPQAGSEMRRRSHSTAQRAPSCRLLRRRRHTACSAASGPARVRSQLL